MEHDFSKIFEKGPALVEHQGNAFMAPIMLTEMAVTRTNKG